jgi:hypothetical protein
MIRPSVLLCGVHARYSIPRSDGPRSLSFHAEQWNTDSFLDQQLREAAQQIVLPCDGVQT